MTRPRVLALSLMGALLAGTVLAACTQFSALGSVIGGGLTVALVVTAWLLTATTQAGCDTFGACLSIPSPLEDASTDAGDARLGPCLSAPWDAGRDAETSDDGTVSPCLSDIGGGPPDTLGPCLSIAPGDAEPLDAGSSTTTDAAPRPDVARAPSELERARQDTIARLAASGTLPADVIEKLTKGRS